MKVKDLIDLLQQSDGELEAFASPLVYFPTIDFDTDNKSIGNESVMRINNPKVRHPITTVGVYTSTYGEDKGNQYLILSYDADALPETKITKDFIN